MKFILLSIFILPIVCVSQDIFIRKDTTLNTVWVIQPTTVIHFENGAVIRGKGTLNGGVLDAPYGKQIFDSAINLQNVSTYTGVFSCAWYGAKVYADAFNSIQKSINTCILNQLPNCFLPKGNYTISKGISIAFIYNGIYAGVALHFYGESDFWADRTVINYTGATGYAIGLQLGKGSEIDHLTIYGQFHAPTTTGATYYNTPIASFGTDNLYGLVVDYDGTKNTSGSTGCKFHDLKVSGFTYLYSVSPNGVTYNADILRFENIQCGEGRIGFQGCQAQEKGNEIHGIYSWGKIHTLIEIGKSGKGQAGDYTIDGGNIAGQCIRLFDIAQKGWYTTKIYNIFSESLGSIGTLQTGDSKNSPPMSITGCTFHFAPIATCGVQTLLFSNWTSVLFSNCMFRYYGSQEPMLFSGRASFLNCFWSGPVNGIIRDNPIALNQIYIPIIP